MSHPWRHVDIGRWQLPLQLWDATCMPWLLLLLLLLHGVSSVATVHVPSLQKIVLRIMHVLLSILLL